MTILYKLGDKDNRPWGNWETIDVGQHHIVKRITIKPQGSVSLQMHNHRSEHWIIVKGIALVTVGNKVKTYSENEHIYIPIQEKHRIANNGPEPLIFIEIQTGDLLDEKDIIRFEDNYGRV